MSLVLGGPLPHVMAAKAIAFKEANTPSFKIYAKKIVDNARALAESFLQKGVRLVTGGTENHLMILDVSSFGLTGRHAESALRAAKSQQPQRHPHLTGKALGILQEFV